MNKFKLPLLDFISSKYKVQLDRILLIASQHILESQRIMFEYFIDKGLKPGNIFLIGKCYSTNREILKKFKKMGIYVSSKSESFDPYLSFDEQFDDYTKELLEYVKKKTKLKEYDKVIILEDGGSLLSHATKIFKEKFNLIGIEQTSAGYERLKNVKLAFPIINVARSHAKLEIEPSIIADVCVERLNKSLIKLRLKPKNVLILGLGAVGNAIYDKIKNNYSVKRYDLNSGLSDYEKESLKSILGQFDMIIGCTGKEVINVLLYKYLKKGVILVSVSSSDREFSAVNFRKMVNGIKNCHEDINVNDVHLLNCGFPINFDGAEDSAPAKKIQLTLALLFSAVCLATRENYQSGLVDLNNEIQKEIIEKFNSF